MRKPNFEMQKAVLLAVNIDAFIKFVEKKLKSDFSDKVYQIKLLVKEFRFQILADELLRINQFDWDEKYSLYLISSLREGLDIIDEYVKRHYSELYIFTARLYTLQHLSLPFERVSTLI